MDDRLINQKQIAFPCTPELKLKNRNSRRMTIPVEAWNHRKEIRFHADLRSALEKITLDPDASLPDRNRTNNVLQMDNSAWRIFNATRCGIGKRKIQGPE